jgi:hypothetical protein
MESVLYREKFRKALSFREPLTIPSGPTRWEPFYKEKDSGVSTVGASPTTAVSDLGENSNTTTATPSSTSAPILATSASPTTTPLETQSDDDLRYRATRIIVLIVKDSIMPHIMNIIDSRRIWIKLCSLYQSSSMNRHLSLKSQLYSLKMKKKMYIFAMRMLVAWQVSLPTLASRYQMTS